MSAEAFENQSFVTRRAVFVLLALLGGVAAATLAGCDAAQPEEPGQLVVEAFLRSGEPLDTLVLRQTLPLGEAAAGAAGGADVRLTLGGEVVRYREVDGRPGRYVPLAPATAHAGASYGLTARWNGQTATAEGRVPPPLRLDTIAVRVPDAPVRTVLVDSLRLDSLDIPAEQGYIYPVEVDLAWSAPGGAFPEGDGYWIQASLRPSDTFSSGVIDFFLQGEAVFRERAARREGFGPGDRRRRWSGVYAVPADSATAPLPAHRLQVGLVRSDSTYARFARTQRNPDRRAPDGNVRGALGVAAGVAVDERVLHIGD